MKYKSLYILGLYIDFIIASALAALLRFLLSFVIPFQNPDWTDIAVAVVLTGIGRQLGLSVGQRLLAYAADELDAPEHKRLWANLLTGTLFLLDGLKQIVRWTQFTMASGKIDDGLLPVFGLTEPSLLKVTIETASGALYVAAGMLLLAFMRPAKALAWFAVLMTTISLFLSRSVIGESFVRATVKRRELQGLPVDMDRIEFMKASAMPFLIAAIFVVILLIMACRERPASPSGKL